MSDKKINLEHAHNQLREVIMKDDEVRFFHQFVVTEHNGNSETKALLELESGQVREVALDKFSFIS